MIEKDSRNHTWTTTAKSTILPISTPISLSRNASSSRERRSNPSPIISFRRSAKSQVIEQPARDDLFRTPHFYSIHSSLKQDHCIFFRFNWCIAEWFQSNEDTRRSDETESVWAHRVGGEVHLSTKNGCEVNDAWLANRYQWETVGADLQAIGSWEYANARRSQTDKRAHKQFRPRNVDDDVRIAEAGLVGNRVQRPRRTRVQ